MSIAERLGAVRERIRAACEQHDRDPSSVELLAVSKTWPAAAVREAMAAGQTAFGENKVQELAGKARELAGERADWHMIGTLQTNKVRDLIEVPGLSLLHSLDRVKLVDKLQAALERSDRFLAGLIQVHAASGEPTKHGVEPGAAAALLAHIRDACPRLHVRGIMAMGPLHGDPAPVFAAVAELRDRLRDATGDELPVLSLGMTGDLEAAIGAGSTLVRVGTAIFGARAPRADAG